VNEQLEVEAKARWVRRSLPGIILTPGERFPQGGESTVREDQSIAEMANEVLMRQAKARADRSGEPIEAAMEAVLNTEAGKQLRDLRDGPHGEQGVEETQVGVARERARERVEDLGKRLGEAPEIPTHG
jgi:hypothetical protein